VIVYQASKAQFLSDAFERDIQDVVEVAYKFRTGRGVGPSEVSSWKESLVYMAKALNDPSIPGDASVAIEYGIPQSGKRIDFILAGQAGDGSASVVIVELKQWSSAERTDRDAIVIARVSRGKTKEVSHPSYQAWSYAALLEGFNEAVHADGLMLKPCAYLHNYDEDDNLTNACYAHYLRLAPVFLKGEAERLKLRAFIKLHVKYGDKSNAIYCLENGRIRPSKSLVDSLARMMKGNDEFILIDDQKVAFEAARAMGRHASDDDKKVMIIEGGPGTGKSVIAINLLVELSKLGLVCQYVSKNAAPRAVYESKLTGVLRRTEMSNLFSGSGAFSKTEKNAFDVLIVDEAHRLNEKSGLYGNLGDHQIKEIMAAAKCSIFFVDDDQRVTFKDIGNKQEIDKYAQSAKAEVQTLELASQFRCNGADSYLAWLDDVLEIRQTANDTFDTSDFDFRIVDSPVVLRNLIVDANKKNNKARMVAGYCWNWVSKKKPGEYDVVIPEHDFSMRWNLSDDGSLWIVSPNSVDEIGCIHTSQGLEVDYVGVVVGPDLIARNGRVVTQPNKRARSDKSISGYKKWLKSDPKAANEAADRIIRNTYRTLMTRGMKGCYVYFTDAETAAYFKGRITGAAPAPLSSNAAQTAQAGEQQVGHNVLPFRVAKLTEIKPYVDAVPLVTLKFAAGSFGDVQFASTGHDEWAVLPSEFRAQEGLFVAQVVGESMNRRIPNGAWCLFRSNPTGTRQGKVVVAQHRDIHDPETGGTYTLKIYKSSKVTNRDGSWRHSEVRLRPDSDDPAFQELVFGPNSVEGIRIIAELVTVF
jgi:DUF2075 family protein